MRLWIFRILIFDGKSLSHCHELEVLVIEAASLPVFQVGWLGLEGVGLCATAEETGRILHRIVVGR